MILRQQDYRLIIKKRGDWEGVENYQNCVTSFVDDPYTSAIMINIAMITSSEYNIIRCMLMVSRTCPNRFSNDVFFIFYGTFNFT